MGSHWRNCKSQISGHLQRRANPPFLLFLLHVCQNSFLYFQLPLLFYLSCAENEEQAALRNGCITKLRQVRAALQTHSTTQTQAQIQADLWSQDQLEDCSLVLLTKLVELQEVQASAVLSALLDKVSRSSCSIRPKTPQRCTSFFFMYPSESAACPNSAR